MKIVTAELVRNYRDKFKAMRNFEDLKEIREGFRDAYNLSDKQALALLRTSDGDKILELLEEVNKNREQKNE